MIDRAAPKTENALEVQPDDIGPRFLSRLLTRRTGGMLLRNTIVGTFVFLVGLGVLWGLVEWGKMGAVPAAAIGFLVSNSLHYVLGRTWIFRGTDRGVGAGYLFFLINAGLGMAITILLFAALLEWTPIHYLVARVIVSVFAGLAMFVLNAVLNFRQV